MELRAAMSLARLWQRQGQREAARQVLAPIYGWFTEGFDMADLQDAKVLVAALGGEQVPASSAAAAVGPPASQWGATTRGGSP